MYPTFPYSELQEKFCEGFAFFPFKALQQCGGYIYKSYRNNGITSGLLEQCDTRGNYSGLHAQILLLKLLQRDIPLGGELLIKIQTETTNLENMAHLDGKRSIIYTQLLETITTYQTILTIYQHQVHEQIVTQLSALCNTDNKSCIEEAGRLSLGHIISIVQKFMDSTHLMCSFLEGWLILDDREGLRSVLKAMAEFRDLQTKNIYVLEQWKEEDDWYKEQQMMN